MHPVLLAFLVASLGGPVGGLAAAAVGATFLRHGGQAVRAAMLAFAGGFMMAVAFLELIRRAIEIVEGWELAVALVGLAAGAGVRALLMRLVGIHRSRRHDEAAYRGLQARKIAVSLAMVDVVEGLTVGVGFAVGVGLGLLLGAIMIFENFTEGVSISTELAQGGHGAGQMVWLTTAPTVTLGLGAAAGAYLGGLSPLVLASLLGAGAGIMLYVVAGDILYDAHHLGRGAITDAPLIAGVGLATAIAALG